MTAVPPSAPGGDRVPAPAEAATTAPPASRTDDIPTGWDERTILTTLLDYARKTVHVKCAGIAEEDARRAPLPSSPLMTISGLVSHLRWVEYSWFEVTLLGADDDAPWTEDDPDREMRIAARDTPGPGVRPGPVTALSSATAGACGVSWNVGTGQTVRITAWCRSGCRS